MPIFVVMLLHSGHPPPRRALEAFRRGRRGAFRAAQPSAELLAQPLDEVRRGASTRARRARAG